MAKQSKEAHHWADATAERIVRQRGERDRYVLAAGITPSGTVHFGNMREIITPELVARALRRAGYGVRFIYLWDDYDRFRKVPANLPGAGWDGYIGAPLSEIPDPYGAASSYARHFAGVFEQQMARLGIEPEWISQAEMYGSGAYADGVRTALHHRQRLRELLDRQRTTPLAADWWPVEVYCACGAGDAGTTVLSWDGADELAYRCSSCNRERAADLRRGDGVKLGWRVDWPMRWAHHRVDFEAAGKDHHTAGGSWETAAPIATEVFGAAPPATLKYDWINVRGVGTMASSSGQLISPADALAVYQPEVVRYLFVRARPDREFEISFDLDVLKTYEDYDRAGRICRGTEQASAARRAREGRAIDLSEVDPERPLAGRAGRGLLPPPVQPAADPRRGHRRRGEKPVRRRGPRPAARPRPLRLALDHYACAGRVPVPAAGSRRARLLRSARRWPPPLPTCASGWPVRIRPIRRRCTRRFTTWPPRTAWRRGSCSRSSTGSSSTRTAGPVWPSSSSPSASPASTPLLANVTARDERSDPTG